MDQSFAVQLLVFHLQKYCRTEEKPVRRSRELHTLVTIIITFNFILGSLKTVEN